MVEFYLISFSFDVAVLWLLQLEIRKSKCLNLPFHCIYEAYVGASHLYVIPFPHKKHYLGTNKNAKKFYKLINFLIKPNKK